MVSRVTVLPAVQAHLAATSDARGFGYGTGEACSSAAALSGVFPSLGGA